MSDQSRSVLARRPVLLGAAIVVVLLGVGLGWWRWSAHQNELHANAVFVFPENLDADPGFELVVGYSIANESGSLEALDPDSGERLWDVSLPPGCNVAGAFEHRIDSDGTLLAIGCFPANEIHAFELSSGRHRWSFSLDAASEFSPGGGHFRVLPGDGLLVGTERPGSRQYSETDLTRFRLSTGEQVWRTPAGFVNWRPVTTLGPLLVVERPEQVLVVDPDTGAGDALTTSLPSVDGLVAGPEALYLLHFGSPLQRWRLRGDELVGPSLLPVTPSRWWGVTGDVILDFGEHELSAYAAGDGQPRFSVPYGEGWGLYDGGWESSWPHLCLPRSVQGRYLPLLLDSPLYGEKPEQRLVVIDLEEGRQVWTSRPVTVDPVGQTFLGASAGGYIWAQSLGESEADTVLVRFDPATGRITAASSLARNTSEGSEALPLYASLVGDWVLRDGLLAAPFFGGFALDAATLRLVWAGDPQLEVVSRLSDVEAALGPPD